MRKAACVLVLLMLAMGVVQTLGGCAAPQREAIIIEPTQYDDTFAAAIEATRQYGMTAIVRDRRSGVIETSPRTAGSIFEPWRVDNADFDQAVANTINHQRRRARIEFTPVDRELPPIDVEQPLTGPDYSGVLVTPLDLGTYDGPIEIDVVVVIERNHRPGMRRSTWTRSVTSQAELGDVNADLPPSFWTPVARDPTYEARLLQRIRELMAAGNAPPPPPGTTP